MSAVGGVAVLVVLVDVLLTTLHPDRDGPIAHAVQRNMWRLHVSVARRSSRLRRRALASAGPTMMAVTLVAWMVLYVASFAVVFWPHLDDAFVADRDVGHGFIEALYYSGITGTVLGYGDVTPVTGVFQMLAFAESGLGFMLLTLMVTYLLNVASALSERDVMALQTEGQAGGGGGAELLVRALRDEELSDVRARLVKLAEGARATHDKLHRFATLSLLYRSGDPRQDPEPMLATLAESAVSAHLVAAGADGRVLRPAVQELDRAVTDLTRMLADQYLDEAAERQIADPQVGDADRRTVARLRERLVDEFGDRLAVSEADSSALHLAARARAVLEGLDELTAWRHTGSAGAGRT